MTQIEQFIESIFPSQKKPLDEKSPASVEEAARAQKEAEVARWDNIYLTVAVIGTIMIVTGSMVSSGLLFYVSM